MAKRGGFPGMGMPGNMNNLMKQAQRMQRQMEQQQAEAAEKQKALEEKEFKATAGGSAVTVTMNGKFEVLSVALAPEAVDPDDIETLQDLIVAATNEAIKQIVKESEEIAQSAQMNLPGGFGF